ncbi:unnamed protein product [Closterium sp. NIES-53]
MAPYCDTQMELFNSTLTFSHNPYPPLGRKPRPCMLAIPETVPPPLSPTPLFFFQKPVPKSQPQESPQEPPPQPQPQDRQRRRLWRDDPEPPRASAPVAGLPEPAEAAPICGSRLNGGMIAGAHYRGRNTGMCAGMGMGHGISLSSCRVNDRKPNSAVAERPVAEHAVNVSQHQLMSHILSRSEFIDFDLQSPNLSRRYRESCGCSVDTSSLWSSLIALVCPEPVVSAVRGDEPRSEPLPAAYDEVLDIPDFVMDFRGPLRAANECYYMVKDAEPVSREAAGGPSPMSVLTPTASEPSPTQPLPAFVW